MFAAELVGVGVPWLIVASLIVFAGAATQASIGVGLGLLAAPTLSLIDADFVPGALVVATAPLVIGMTVREHVHVDVQGIWRALIGRVGGIALGAWLLTRTGQQTIAIVIGVSVLLAVAASLGGVHVAPTGRNLVVAGAASGFAGAVAGVGGPPMALTYQHADPRILRATLSAFHVFGAAMTIPSLMLAGVIGGREAQLALLLIPGVLLGLWSGKYVIARLPPARVRPLVLVACAAAAVLLLGRQVA